MRRILPLRSIPHPPSFATENRADDVLQTATGPRVATTNLLNFPGVGQGDYGYSPNVAPPDTNGAAGATQYVQWVNTSFAVFDKVTGSKLLGPITGNTLWSGFGGGCQNNNDGDIVVKYDRIANRWVMAQFSVSTLPYLECVAISKTSDATGAWYRYAFSYGDVQFPDYPKIGVWPDAYYAAYNIFTGGHLFAGAKLCAFNRAKMLTGAAATQQCFQLSSTFGGVLPADLDGATLPPSGAPNYMVALGRTSTSLDLWRFHVNWTTPSLSTLTGPIAIAVPAYVLACNGGGTCIPQKGTKQELDSLADRLMYRLAYRNFGSHESIVVNHSVATNTAVGVRWYELRSPGSAPTLYQSGTFDPDNLYRWMGSIAMDKAGDIAVGYSTSGSTVYPSIRYSGRVPTDPVGTLESEAIIKPGGGSQTGRLSRWGDYSGMSLDPVDDCTFYYATEYLKTTGSFNWSTEIASFKFPGCS